MHGVRIGRKAIGGELEPPTTQKSLEALSSFQSIALPKRRLNPQLIHGLDEAADIVAEDLAEYFIRHGHVGLAADMITEFRLDHTEGAFDVRPLMIVPQEFLTVEREVVKHLRAP